MNTRVNVIVHTENQDHMLPSEMMTEKDAQQWLVKINAMITSALETVETSWMVANRTAVVGAYLSS